MTKDLALQARMIREFSGSCLWKYKTISYGSRFTANLKGVATFCLVSVERVPGERRQWQSAESVGKTVNESVGY